MSGTLGRCEKGLFEMLSGCYGAKNKAPVAHLSPWHGVCRHSGAEGEAGASKGGSAKETDFWT